VKEERHVCIEKETSGDGGLRQGEDLNCFGKEVVSVHHRKLCNDLENVEDRHQTRKLWSTLLLHPEKMLAIPLNGPSITVSKTDEKEDLEISLALLDSSSSGSSGEGHPIHATLAAWIMHMDKPNYWWWDDESKYPL
jgi:hypothetical protein